MAHVAVQLSIARGMVALHSGKLASQNVAR